MIEAVPRFATPRTPSRRTRGGEVARVAELLGWPELHPWQREALDVAMEVDDEGRLVYGQVVLLVPRRAGKTVVGLSTLVHRAWTFGSPQRSLSNMQAGVDSRAMFVDTWLPILERSAFSDAFTPVRALSHEQLRWANGSIHSVRAPGPKAAVGSDLDYWLSDEAWAIRDDAMEGAVLPTMATRPDPQVWVVSMAGTAASKWFIGKRDLGRELVTAGINTGTCFIEFSAPPDADPMDEDVWWSCHPALGRTITLDRLRSFAQSMDRAEFAQHFLGIWRDTAAHVPIFSEESWEARKETDPSSPRAQLSNVWLAVDLSPSRKRAAVAVAGTRPDGTRQVEIIRADDGTSWLAAYVRQVCERQEIQAVGVDVGGPAGSVWPEIERELDGTGTKLLSLAYSDAAKGAGAFHDAVLEGRVWHTGQALLDDAVALAIRKPRGEAFTWGRSTPSTDITPLVAVSLAHWLAVSQNPGPQYDSLIL